MVQEMSDLPTGDAKKENSRSEELNIEKLRTFSRSLENLNSETLYSKWKRARGEGTRSTRRMRSMSLTTAPNFTSDGKDQRRQPARKNSFHVLQENVFRPRCWTIGVSAMEVIKEQNAMQTLDFNNNTVERSTQGSSPQLEKRRRKLGQQFRVTLQIPNKQNSIPTADQSKMEKTNEAEIKPVNVEQKDKSNGKQAAETTSEIFIKSSQRLRRVSEDIRENEGPPIVVQPVSEEFEGKSAKTADMATGKSVGNLIIEAVRVEIPPQPMSMPASPNFQMRKPEVTFMDTVESPMEPSWGLNSTVVKDASEMRTNNDRSKTLQNTFSLGCTYAVVSQPSPRTKDNYVNQPAVKMSNGITKEQRKELEEQFKKLKKVSLELDRAEIEEGSFNKLYTLPEVGTKESLDSQPLRRFSELNNSITRRRKSSRPTAKALLENIANASHKTEKERIQQIEKAFEWIRKELAELRAQDKDIMRTFTKIQAGIRKIKLQRAFSNDMDEPYEFDVVDHSVDLSASFSYVPLVKDFHNTFPRRASLI